MSNPKTTRQTKTRSVKWARNKGSQQGLLDKPDPEKPIMLQRIYSKNREWGWADIGNLMILVEEDLHLFEIILTDNPRKIYFDIDKPCDLKDVSQYIGSIFPNADIQISGSVTPDKVSYHIIVSNYHFDNADLMKRYMLPIVNEYNDRKEGEIFDNKVYTKNRAMKLINQSKGDGRVQRYISGSKDVRKHFITCEFDENSVNAMTVMPEIREIVSHPKNTKSTRSLTISDIPSAELDLTEKMKEITNIFDLSALELLKLIPIYPRGHKNCLSNRWMWSIGLFAFNQAVPFDMLWDIIKAKDSSDYRRSKYLSYWNNTYPHIKCTMTFMSIINILERFYPKITQDRSYNMFTQFRNITPTTIIQHNFLNRNDLSDAKYQLLHVNMGGNKTGATISYLKDTDTDFVWISPRISLSKNIEGRMTNEGVVVKNYLNLGTKKEKKQNMAVQKKLICSAQSLHYLGEKTFTTVIIDEIETVMFAFYTTDTHNGRMKENWETLLNLLKSANKVIIMDAFLTTRTIDFLRENDVGAEIEIIGKQNRPPNRDLIVNTFKDAEDSDQEMACIVTGIVEKLMNREKLYIFYPFKRGNKRYPSMDTFAKMIAKSAGLTDSQYITYNADTADSDKHGLTYVNTVWNSYEFVVTNSSITVGVNYDNLDFDSAVFIWAPFVLPRDLVQTSYRIRTLRNNRVTLIPLKMRNIKPDPITKIDLNCPIYNKLFYRLKIEDSCKTTNCLINFMYQANYNPLNHINLPNVNKDILTKFENDYLSVGTIYSYDSIPTISQQLKEEYSLNTYCSLATTNQKLSLNKYFFKEIFDEETPDEVIKQLWDDNLVSLVYQIRKYIHKKPVWIDRVEKELGIVDIELPKKIKLSGGLKKEIYDKFYFRTMSSDGSANKLISKAMKSFFKFPVWEPDFVSSKSKAVSWSINEDFKTTLTTCKQWLKPAQTYALPEKPMFSH